MDEYKEEEEEEKEEEDGGVSTKDIARQSSGGDVSLTQFLSSPQSPQQVFSLFSPNKHLLSSFLVG